MPQVSNRKVKTENKKTVEWYRGHQEGVYEAYLSIVRKYPIPAKVILKLFGMDINGNIRL